MEKQWYRQVEKQDRYDVGEFLKNFVFQKNIISFRFGFLNEACHGVEEDLFGEPVNHITGQDQDDQPGGSSQP